MPSYIGWKDASMFFDIWLQKLLHRNSIYMLCNLGCKCFDYIFHFLLLLQLTGMLISSARLQILPWPKVIESSVADQTKMVHQAFLVTLIVPWFQAVCVVISCAVKLLRDIDSLMLNSCWILTMTRLIWVLSFESCWTGSAHNYLPVFENTLCQFHNSSKLQQIW